MQQFDVLSGSKNSRLAPPLRILQFSPPQEEITNEEITPIDGNEEEIRHEAEQYQYPAYEDLNREIAFLRDQNSQQVTHI